MTCLVRSLDHGDLHYFNTNVNSTLDQSDILIMCRSPGEENSFKAFHCEKLGQ